MDSRGFDRQIRGRVTCAPEATLFGHSMNESLEGIRDGVALYGRPPPGKTRAPQKRLRPGQPFALLHGRDLNHRLLEDARRHAARLDHRDAGAVRYSLPAGAKNARAAGPTCTGTSSLPSGGRPRFTFEFRRVSEKDVPSVRHGEVHPGVRALVLREDSDASATPAMDDHSVAVTSQHRPQRPSFVADLWQAMQFPWVLRHPG